MKSLKWQLIVLLVALLSAMGMVAGAISYYFAKSDAGELLDHQLREVARSIDEGSQLPAMQERFLNENEEERENDFVIQVWYKDEPVRSSRPNFSLTREARAGFSIVSAERKKWRVFTAIYPERTVQVSLSEDVRDDIAESSALRSALPIAGLIPLSWLLIAFVVGRIFRPLDRVTEAATQRDASSLDPLPSDSVPLEVEPLVSEMNALIERLREALESQRQFVSEAAHELRTPLAALQLQIENISASRSRDDISSSIGELKLGLQRAIRLVNQLLKMARFEADSRPVTSETSLTEIVKDCISGFIPLAEKKNIDLGMVRDEEIRVFANRDELRILFDNLLDNAIRYTQEGGKIDISVALSSGRAFVEISDDGPGIAEDLLPRVFDRFFRATGQEIEGSGIGLSIVNAIAKRESAEVFLSNKEEGSGIIAKVAIAAL